MRVMPLSTVCTPGRLPAKRNAHEATLISGSAFLKTSCTWGGIMAKDPPRTGSMMMTGLLYLRATS